MSQVQQVKEATDIIQVIGERIQLQRSGSSYKGPCPFHSEKTPSFFVSDQLQRYRCFGCGETGDSLDFLQKYEGMSFSEALQYLAEQAGIELKEFQKTTEDDLRERLLALLHLAAEYYHYLLCSHPVGEKAREYLQERKVTQGSIELFQIGYSHSSWDGLVKYLHHKKKYRLEDIEQTGLIIRGRGGRYYDRFRGRVMFPLKDHRGRVVGFSGRLLEKDAKEAKYINTPETLLYHKSQMLFGYKELFSEIKKKNEVIVVEGEFDVVSSAQAHINNVVAIKGSALTSEQVKLLSRVAHRVILCLDADEAGAKATKRAIEVVGEADVELRVIDLSGLEGGQKDVDDLARTAPKIWRELEKQTVSVYEFLLRLSLRHHDPETPEGKREIMKEVGLILGGIPHAVERDFYIQKLAETLRVSKDVIQQDITKLQQRVKIKTQEKEKDLVEALPTRQQVLERYLFFLLFETLDFDKKLPQLTEISFQTAGLSEILEFLHKKKGEKQKELGSITRGLAEDLKQLVFDIISTTEYRNLKESVDIEKEWEKTLHSLQKESARMGIQVLQKDIQLLDEKQPKTAAEEKKLEDLLRKVAVLQKTLRKEGTPEIEV